tara:strand:+ start:4243 stop:4398 length:156 start_codon:yes stop_codon:yes gene_type:complete
MQSTELCSVQNQEDKMERQPVKRLESADVGCFLIGIPVMPIERLRNLPCFL